MPVAQSLQGRVPPARLKIVLDQARVPAGRGLAVLELSLRQPLAHFLRFPGLQNFGNAQDHPISAGCKKRQVRPCQASTNCVAAAATLAGVSPGR